MGNLSKLLTDVGALDQLVYLMTATKSADATGGQVETWATGEEPLWAKVEYGTQSDEGMRGEDQQVVAYRVVRFTVRYGFTIDETMRLSYNGDEYDIHSISRLGRERFLVIEAEKRDNETS